MASNVRMKIAAGATVLGLGGLAGYALGSNDGQPPSASGQTTADKPKPKVHTQVVHRTIHVRPKGSSESAAAGSGSSSGPAGSTAPAAGSAPTYTPAPAAAPVSESSYSAPTTGTSGGSASSGGGGSTPPTTGSSGGGSGSGSSYESDDGGSEHENESGDD